MYRFGVLDDQWAGNLFGFRYTLVVMLTLWQIFEDIKITYLWLKSLYLLHSLNECCCHCSLWLEILPSQKWQEWKVTKSSLWSTPFSATIFLLEFQIFNTCKLLFFISRSSLATLLYTALICKLQDFWLFFFPFFW